MCISLPYSGLICQYSFSFCITSIIKYMKKFRNTDQLRAVQLIPKSTILCYYSLILCYQTCKFMLSQCIFVLLHFGGKKPSGGKTNMAATARQKSWNISLKYELNQWRRKRGAAPLPTFYLGRPEYPSTPLKKPTW